MYYKTDSIALWVRYCIMQCHLHIFLQWLLKKNRSENTSFLFDSQTEIGRARAFRIISKNCISLILILYILYAKITWIFVCYRFFLMHGRTKNTLVNKIYLFCLEARCILLVTLFPLICFTKIIIEKLLFYRESSCRQIINASI